MVQMKFGDFVETNPRIKLEKNQQYDFVEMADVDPNRKYVYSPRKRIAKGGSKFESGDILFARITPCLEHGKIALFKSENKKPAFGSTEFFVFREKKGVSDKDYVYYLSKTDIIRKPAEKSMVGASGRQRANLDAIKEIEFNALELPIQKKIATILTNYDDLIENNLQRIKFLEKIAKLIYDEWFIKFKFPGNKTVKLIDSETGKIPEDWNIKQIKDFGEVLTGKTPPTKNKDNYDNYKLFIKPPDMQNGMYCVDTVTKISKLGEQTQIKKTLPINSLVVSCIGTVGLVTITALEAQTNQQINSIKPHKSYTLEYLYFKLKSLKIKLENLGACGATMPNVSKGKFENMHIVEPKNELLIKYSDLVNPLFIEIKNLLLSNKKLKETRNILLPKLIQEEVDVSELDIQVPEVEV